MVDPGKVEGAKLKELFTQLINNQTIISMNLVGTGFGRLTCITGLKQESKQDYLLVDMPDGFMEAAAKDNACHLRFNFNGPDHLEYIFNTACGIPLGRDLQIPFPDHVERLQRRKNFRIDTPPGTRMVFRSKKLKGVIDLINISLGGTYGVLVQHNLKDARGPVMKVDQRLYHISIIFPADSERGQQAVAIKKAEVRRIEHDKDNKLYKYAFEFMDIDKNENKKLTLSIYHIQREQLKRR